MATEIIVPTLGESVTEATVAKWFKGVGEAVNVDEPLVELETDKVTVEVPAPASGVISAIAAHEGADVEVGAVLCTFEAGAQGSAPQPAAAAAAPAPAPAPVATPALAPATAPVAPAPVAAPAAAAPLSPAVRKLVEENNLNPAAITGTGKDGRLTKGDVQSHMASGAQAAPAPVAAAPAPAPAPAASAAPAQYPPRPIGPREERVPMTRLRKRIAERLKEAQNTAAMLTTYNEVDMTNLLAVRNSYKEGFLKKHGVKLGFMSFFTKACVVALREYPAVNGEINGGDIIYKNYYDIGVAVGTPTGLVVPVVREADTLSFADLEKTIAGYGASARDGKLALEDMMGGTFTISNGGVYGSLMSSPIINPPQSAILGMHKTQLRPMVMPDGSIEARPMMYLALSYDHRIIDGKEAVLFLVRVKECIEDPQRIMLDA